MKQTYGTLTRLILRLAARECGCHSSNPELEGYSATQVGQRGAQLVADGLLFRAKFSHRNVRFYASMASAQKAEANNRKTLAMAKVGKAHSQVRYASLPPGEAVYHKDFAGIQYCPSALPGFQSVELPNIFGGNQRGRVLCE